MKEMNTIQALVQRSENEQAHMHELHSGQPGALFAAPLLPFSSLSLLLSFFFSVSPVVLSSFCFSKVDFGKGAPGRQPYGRHKGHLGSICGLWMRVKHLCCAQKPQNLSPGEAKTQKPTKSTVARKRRFFERYISVFKDTFYDILDGRCQRKGIAPCAAKNGPGAWRPMAFTRPWFDGV